MIIKEYMQSSIYCLLMLMEQLSSLALMHICCGSILPLVQFLFSFVPFSLSNITIHKNKEKYKLNQGKN